VNESTKYESIFVFIGIISFKLVISIMISTEQVKELRDKTGISVMQCKKALEETGGDLEKALVVLKRKGNEVAEKKADRELKSGVVASYIHSTGRVGAMVELLCETDFVANNDEFKQLAYDIAMQVAATDAQYLTANDINEEEMAKAKEIIAKEVEGKPADMQEKILQGKLDSYFSDKVLLNQSFIKDSDKTIEDLIKGATQKFGERTEVGKFEKFIIGA